MLCWGSPDDELEPYTYVVGRAGVRRLELGGRLRALKIAGMTMIALRADGVLSRWQGLRGEAREIASGVTAAALTAEMLCLQKQDGRVHCGDLGRRDVLATTWEIVEAKGATAIVGAGDRLCVRTAGGAIGCWGHRTPFELLASDVPMDARSFTLDREGRLLVVTRDGGVTIHGRSPRSIGEHLPPMIEVAAMDADRLCGRAEAGELVCWRLGGVLRARRASTRPLPVGRSPHGEGIVVVELPAGAQSLSAGDEHMCTLTEDGAVWCWGSNQHGQIGDGGFGATLAPARVDGVPGGIRDVVIDRTATCALDERGAVFCWGGDYVWPRPQEVHSDPPLRLLTAGDGKLCGVTHDEDLLCGHIIPGEPEVRWGPPLPLRGTLKPAHIADGRGWICAAGEGRLGCWAVGTDEEGAPQWGRGQIAGEDLSFRQLRGAWSRVSGVDDKGRAISWQESKASGHLSLDKAIIDSSWTNVDEVLWGMCRRKGTEVRCRGGVQDPPPTSRRVPSSGGYVTTPDGLGLERRPRVWDQLRIDEETEIPGRFSAIVGGRSHACGLREDHRVVCWGRNSAGQLGDGSADESWPPSPVVGISGSVASIWAHGSTSCAFVGGEEQELWCWGGNEHGQVGDGRSGHYLRPRRFDASGW